MRIGQKRRRGSCFPPGIKSGVLGIGRMSGEVSVHGPSVAATLQHCSPGEALLGADTGRSSASCIGGSAVWHFGARMT